MVETSYFELWGGKILVIIYRGGGLKLFSPKLFWQSKKGSSSFGAQREWIRLFLRSKKGGLEVFYGLKSLNPGQGTR